MKCDVDSFVIEQIKNNVYNEKADIYLPCLKTHTDLLGEKNEFSESAEIFFEFAALHKSRGIELKQRKEPVRAFRTSPIEKILHEIAIKDYETNNRMNISRAVELLFSSSDPSLFESVMPPQISVFEKALILKEECGDSANIIIVSNDPNIYKVKEQAEEESKKKFSEDDFTIMTTKEWLQEQFIQKKNSDVRSIVFSIVDQKKTEMKIGNVIIKTES